MTRKKNKAGYLRQTFTMNGKRYQVYAHTATELCEKVAKKREEISQNIDSHRNPTLQEYFESYQARREHEVKENTRYVQMGRFKKLSGVKLAGVAFKDIKIKELTRGDIETAREILLEGGASTEYVNQIFGFLAQLLESATVEDIIQKNPVRGLKKLKRDRKPARETKHRALTKQETTDFFKAARENHSFLLNAFLVLIKTGMRTGELAALTFEDIDAKTGFIHIKHTLTRTANGGYIIGETPKTSSGLRDIPLTRELYDIFRKQRGLNAFIFGADKATDSTPLFRSIEGALLLNRAINIEIRNICKAAGVEVFTAHAFRDTFATRFIEQRPQDYKILSEILGHSKIDISLNLYTHVMTESKVEAMNDVQIITG